MACVIIGNVTVHRPEIAGADRQLDTQHFRFFPKTPAIELHVVAERHFELPQSQPAHGVQNMEVPVGPVTLPNELVRAELDRRLLLHHGGNLMMIEMCDTPAKDRSGRWLVLDLRGPELLRAGQEPNQIARAVDQYREVLRTYPKRRTAIVERE